MIRANRRHISTGQSRMGVLVSVMALVLAACGSDAADPTTATTVPGAPEAAEKLTVVVVSSPSADALAAVATSFTAETGIQVEFVEQPYDQVTSAVLLAAETGNSDFDIIQFDNAFMPELVEGGALEPLDDYLTSEAYDLADFSDQVVEYSQYQGASYGIPLSTEPYILWYRTDLFEELGLEPPATMDEYVANAQALDAAGYFGSDNGYGSGIGGYYWWQHLVSYGLDVFDPATCDVLVDTPEFLDATRTYLDLVPYTPDTAVNGGGDEMNAIFTQEDVGQQINATGYYSLIADPDESRIVGNFDAALAPLGSPDGQTLLFGWLIGVSANSTNKDAAWQYLEHALGKEGVRDLIDAGGPPPGRLSLLEDDAMTEQLPYLPILVEAAAKGYHLPYIPEIPAIINALSPALNSMATGGADPVDVLPGLSAEIEGILADRTSCEG